LLLAALTMCAAVPLYRHLPQEFVPRNVDEGEFEINLTAREGASLKAMEEVADRVEDELRSMPQIRVRLISVGGGRIDGVNRVRAYVRLAPHEERTFSIARLFQWPPWKAWDGIYSQTDVIREVRARLKNLPDLRLSIRGTRSSISAGGLDFEFDFSLL